MLKISAVYERLKNEYEEGYKLFNIYHIRKTDNLIIQLKKPNGEGKTLKFVCSYPVYKYEISKIKSEDNIFKSLYLMDQIRCSRAYVGSDVINNVGKIDTNNKQCWEDFNPQKFLVYNVFRPEYYLSTLDHTHLPFEDTKICSLDIEIFSDTGEFPEPKKAKFPVSLLTVFDFKTHNANVFYLDGFGLSEDVNEIKDKIQANLKKKKNGEEFPVDINIKVHLHKFDNEAELLDTLIRFLNKYYSIVVGWNINEFDMAYITSRAKKLKLKLDYNLAADGFSYCFVFEKFFTLDFISIYKFFVDKNPASMKLSAISESKVGVSKLETDTMMDVAYNITDTVLPYLIDRELNLIELMFSFKDNGALLHVFNVKNVLEPFFIKVVAAKQTSFIANSYTQYYNVYFNEVYKLINHDVYGLQKEDLEFGKMESISHFMTNLLSFKEVLKLYLKGDDKEATKQVKDSAGVVLSKLIEKVFKDPSKRKSKKVDPDVLEDDSIPVVNPEPNFNMKTDSLNKILTKLYGMKIDTIFSYPGAYNKSFRGMEEDVIDLDFFSMYPTIIYSLNISFETARYLMPLKSTIYKIYSKDRYDKLAEARKYTYSYNLMKDVVCRLTKDQLDEIYDNENHIIANSGMIFDKTRGLIPGLCERFLIIRDKYKQMMKTEEDVVKKGKYNIYQLLYKVYNNSIYGYLGYRYSIMFNRLLVSSVTIMGRSEILYANYKIYQKLSKGI